MSALVGFGLYYTVGTAASRETLTRPQPELEWLRREYGLTDAQFTEIQALHQEYAPRCARMCARISEMTARDRELYLEYLGELAAG